MVSLPCLARRTRLAAIAVAALCASTFGAISSARAQQQESGFLDRINNPDRTLHYSPADKQFAVASSAANKQAVVRPFAFSRPATLRAGDGAFGTKAYDAQNAFRTKDFATHADPGVGKSFAQTDKLFSTKGFDVHEDRAANKSLAAPIHEYAPFDKPFLGRGRRQDSIDDLRKQKNLTVDQVREILNKNK